MVAELVDYVVGVDTDPQTRDYIARRIGEGKSRREAARLLKRYLARRLDRLLQHQEPPMT
jgi:hypothetical protein